MSVNELGEFGLIARLTERLEQRLDVALGVGDDAALLIPPAGQQLVVTCDAQVDGRHFRLGVAQPAEIGHKALAVNLSDVAAMGAVPRWALVSLLLPGDLAVATLDGIYDGMRALARHFDVAIVGGNVSATDGPLIVDITLIGTCFPGRALTRAGGRPGDCLLVVGTLGAAAAGLLAMAEPARLTTVSTELLARARRAQVAPTPLVEVGRALAESATVSALLDISDGLAGDLRHLCARSGVGARVNLAALPIDPAAHAIASALGQDAANLALTGGEDYALLCAAPLSAQESVRAVARLAGSEAVVIGELTEAAAGLRLCYPDGSELPLTAGGWDHLRAAR